MLTVAVCIEAVTHILTWNAISGQPPQPPQPAQPAP